MTPIEGIIYTASGIRYQENMTGWQYARSLLYSNLAMGVLVLFALYASRSVTAKFNWLEVRLAGI
jgi:K+-transporting ATPase ATPase A chain